MLWVAFSRRMCCSRVWSASTNPRRPSASSVSPAILPGIRRRCASVAQKNPNDGPPKSSRPPSGCPSPTATSTPHSPGWPQHAQGQRVDRGDGQRTRLPGRRGEGLQVLHRPQEVRVLDEQRRRVGIDRRRQLVGVGQASLEAHLDHLGAEPARVGAKRLAAVGMNAPRDDQAPSLGGADRQVGGGRHRRRALVQRGVGDRQPAQLGDRGLELEHHLQAALGDLGLVGRVGGQELGALGDRVDDRRRVVVVHPGAQEADLALGVDVAPRQGRQVVEALGLRQARRAGRGTGPAAGRRESRRTARRSSRRRSPRASPRGRHPWLRCSGSCASALP